MTSNGDGPSQKLGDQRPANSREKPRENRWLTRDAVQSARSSRGMSGQMLQKAVDCCAGLPSELFDDRDERS